MKIKLECPVCGYKQVLDDNCPNCDNNLALIRMLHSLPETENARVTGIEWHLVILGAVFLIGLGIGTLSSFLFQQPINSTVNVPNSVVIVRNQSNPAVLDTLPQKTETTKPTIYKVRPGDNLSVIAEKVCGNSNFWQLILEANPQLKQRRNYYIDPNEEFIVPCEEAS